MNGIFAGMSQQNWANFAVRQRDEYRRVSEYLLKGDVDRATKLAKKLIEKKFRPARSDFESEFEWMRYRSWEDTWKKACKSEKNWKAFCEEEFKQEVLQ